MQFLLSPGEEGDWGAPHKTTAGIPGGGNGGIISQGTVHSPLDGQETVPYGTGTALALTIHSLPSCSPRRNLWCPASEATTGNCQPPLVFFPNAKLT